LTWLQTVLFAIGLQARLDARRQVIILRVYKAWKISLMALSSLMGASKAMETLNEMDEEKDPELEDASAMVRVPAHEL
jgi:hypothetical protein